jgi:hypothetical protein
MDNNTKECTGCTLSTGCLRPQRTGKTEGTFYNTVPGLFWYALHSYSYAELLHSKKVIERGSKKGIALMTLQAMCIVQQAQPCHDHYTT